MESREKPVEPGRDINLVLRAHEQELMSVSGVVGIYVGVLPDESTPCLKVMAAKLTQEMKRIPRHLEGYPVIIEETGTIKPMRSR
jgi:hypothetical protein